MNATIEIGEFWRVGRRADPLAVNVRYQGAGRFDDPEHLVAVLYGAPTLRACLLEFLLPWQSAPQAPTILAAIPPPTDEDEAADAEQDRRLASEPWRIPLALYDRDAIRVRADPVLALLSLRDVAVRERLASSEGVARELRCWDFTQLDRGALLSPQRSLTQAVAGAILRGPLADTVDGLYAESRHIGDLVVVFAGDPFNPQLAIIAREPITASHADLVAIASELQLVPESLANSEARRTPI